MNHHDDTVGGALEFAIECAASLGFILGTVALLTYLF